MFAFFNIVLINLTTCRITHGASLGRAGRMGDLKLL